MSFKNMLLYSATVLLAGLATAAPTNCMNPVRVITVRGTNEVLGESCLKNVFSSILGQGVNAVLQGTPYPAILDYSNNAVYGGSVTAGIYALQNEIRDAVNACPNQKIVLLGYSQGANVIGDALCSSTASSTGQLDYGTGSHIAAIALFGDPAHVVGQSFVRGGASQNGMIPRYNNMQCAPYTDKIVSFCHPNDPVCATGSDISQHLNYMPSDDDQAAQFIASKL